ncbi:MAG: penicillin-binding protein 2 [Candidatus Omnitrophica bacterium]|nr:penicillin-binding protein 2 [Candidatus Omnitrophota bacterium]
MKERLLGAVIFALFALVVLGLIYTQIFRFGYYSRLSKNNAIRIIPIEGPRGRIFDRNGVLLVTNRLSFNVSVVDQEVMDRIALIKFLADTLDIPVREVSDALEKARARPYAPVAIFEDIDKEKALVIEEASIDLNGLVVETKGIRHYIYEDDLCHVLGYLTEINERELEKLRDYGYRMKDLVGRAGIEKYYNSYLAGTAGGLQIEVDNRGRQRRVLGLKEPSNGKDIYLTIDIELQKLCDTLLGDKTGAVMIMDTNNGEVLALASHPAFDPNLFIMPTASDERVRILNDKRGKPLLDRAISGVYQPGSVFKAVIATGALESGSINYYTRFSCEGSYVLGNRNFDCWKEDGHGSQNVTVALMNSCNIFFYQTGRAMGVDCIETFARMFGFGKPTGIDLPNEASGVVPGRRWKRLYRRDGWYEGDTVNYAIGQGYLLVTPIQVLEMMTIIANDGMGVKPFVAKKVDTTNISAAGRYRIPVKAETFKRVKEGLYKAINSESGTARMARVDGLSVAGKTGTAQNPGGRTHAWFAGFAPLENSKIAVVVFLEHGGHGGGEASEIAKKIFEKARDKGYI